MVEGMHTEIIKDIKHINKLKEVFKIIKPEIKEEIEIERFYDKDKGVDRIYNVYKVKVGKLTYILKKSDENEVGVYENYLQGKNLPVPKLEGWTTINNTIWVLIEYILGSDLRKFNKDMAFECAESLSTIFNMYWQEEGSFEENNINSRFERYWTRINKRSRCLKEEQKLSEAYRIFLDRQLTSPRTLCNGDFLQFNAIKNNSGITIIDWGFAGVMPYSLDIARLIIHGSEEVFPFPFYMTNEYRKIFIKKLYNNLIYKPDYNQYVWDVVLSCLNECIEFIESELNDNSIEREEIFNYYYKTAHILSDIILKGKEKFNI